MGQRSRQIICFTLFRILLPLTNLAGKLTVVSRFAYVRHDLMDSCCFNLHMRILLSFWTPIKSTQVLLFVIDSRDYVCINLVILNN